MADEAVRILVVDDDAFVVEMLAEVLSSYNYVVETARNGKEGYDKYVDERAFNLIVSDMDMPVMTGLEMTRKLRAEGYEVPVLILTGNMDLQVAVDALKSGAGDYILKSEDIHESIILAVENALEKQRLREQNRTLEQMVDERTKALNATLKEVKESNKKLDIANQLIRRTFGRYLSDDVVEDILSSPDGASLGGESRLVTVMMTDLRGFTSISEVLPAGDVVSIINIYLEKMTELILKYQGTVIEFIGDSVFVIFGAPLRQEDDARRAVACAVEMQIAMAEVNKLCREKGYPEVEQGIGLNTGELIVGNIGSDKRTKYGAVGRNVNLTARIESYTVGGQILVSENTLQACGPVLRVDDSMEVMPKGVKKPLHIYEISGIGGDYNLYLPPKTPPALFELQSPLPVKFSILEGKHASMELHDGSISKLGSKFADIASTVGAEKLSNLKLTLFDEDGREISSDLYAKITETFSVSPPLFRVNFTSVPAEVKAFLNGLLSVCGEMRP